MKKVRQFCRGFRKDQAGATAAETAITIMWFLLIIFGIMQFTLMLYAKQLVNYAAFTAARAAIVFNGTETFDSRLKMRQAAAAALSPLYATSDDPAQLAVAYAQALAKSDLPTMVGGWTVEIISPEPGKRFSKSYDKRFFPQYRRYDDNATLTAADRKQLDENLVTVKVTVPFHLRLPLISNVLRVVFQYDPVAKAPYLLLSSTHQMRMQSDALTQ